MNVRLRQFLYAVLLFLLCACSEDSKTAFNPEDVPNPKTAHSEGRHYVSNPDGILTTLEVADLDAMCGALEDQTNVQLAIAVVNSIGDWDDYEFGIALFRHWGVGHKDENDGVLFLYVGDTHKIRINVGSGIEDVLPDVTCSRIIQHDMIPCFKAGHTGNGLLCGAIHVWDVLTDSNDAESLRTSLIDGSYVSGTFSDALADADSYATDGADEDTIGNEQEDTITAGESTASLAAGLMGSDKRGAAETSNSSEIRSENADDSDEEESWWSPILYYIFGIGGTLFTVYFVWDELRKKTKTYSEADDSRSGCGCFLIPILGVFAWLIHPLYLIGIPIWLLARRYYYCPKCGRYGCTVKHKDVLKKPTEKAQGKQTVTWSCRHCGDFTVEERLKKIVPAQSSDKKKGGKKKEKTKKKSSSWWLTSDSDSDDDYSFSSNSDSWGGGDSSGGGAGGSW